ncbi:hypothetical protein BASA62_007318 [Batrachochytrium salamandrivorans]|nr:hypothetical protein BASA62_007318 [Batrachochytrium salamandrivorans]
MVKDADQDTMESKEGSVDARLNPRLSLQRQLQISTKLVKATCRKAEELQIRRDKCVGKCKKDKKAAGLKAGVIIDEMLNLKKVVRLGNGIDDVTASNLIEQAKQRFEEIFRAGAVTNFANQLKIEWV